MAIDSDLILKLKNAIRVKSDSANEELEDLTEACLLDLKISGVSITDQTDALFRQALKLYCKAYYGYDDDSEKFKAAYAALKDSMALSGDYREEQEG